MDCDRFYFGRHRDEPVDQVPTDYLRWCVRDVGGLKPWLRQAIEAELKRRDGSESPPPQPPDWPDVIRRWYLDLVARWHPDRGGTTEAMQAINDAHDLLRRLTGAGG